MDEELDTCSLMASALMGAKDRLICLEKELERSRGKNEEMQELVETSARDYRELEKEYHSFRETSRERLDKITKEFDELQQSIETTDDLSVLRMKIAEEVSQPLEEKIRLANHRIGEEARRATAARREAQQRQLEISRLQEKFEKEIESEAKKYLCRIAIVEERAGSFEAKAAGVVDLSRTVKDLRDEVHRKNVVLKDMARRTALAEEKHKKQVTILDGELAARESTQAQAIQDAVEAKAAKTRAESRLKDAEESLGRLRADAAKALAENERKLKEVMDSAKADATAKDKDLAELRAKLESLVEQNRTLSQSNCLLEQSLEQKASEALVDSHREAGEEAQKEISVLRSKLALLAEKTQRLEQDKLSLEREVELERANLRRQLELERTASERESGRAEDEALRQKKQSEAQLAQLKALLDEANLQVGQERQAAMAAAEKVRSERENAEQKLRSEISSLREDCSRLRGSVEIGNAELMRLKETNKRLFTKSKEKSKDYKGTIQALTLNLQRLTAEKARVEQIALENKDEYENHIREMEKRILLCKTAKLVSVDQL